MEGDEDLFPSVTTEEFQNRGLPEDMQTVDGMLNFLEKSVFYPAACFDVEVIGYLKGEMFSNFIYVDLEVEERNIGVFFGKSWDGYELTEKPRANWLFPGVLFGSNQGYVSLEFYQEWGKFDKAMAKKYNRVAVDRPLALCAEFKKVSKVKGPETIRVIYIKSEAVSIFKELFKKKGIMPAVCAYSSHGFSNGGDLLKAVFDGGSKSAGFFECAEIPSRELKAKYGSYKKMGRWVYYYNK